MGKVSSRRRKAEATEAAEKLNPAQKSLVDQFELEDRASVQ
ncbi:MAG: hypothetical protein P4K94_07765 [Terracidiphilus sp.]|nr:hypothetical protein [Terracidiphilus sp.]